MKRILRCAGWTAATVLCLLAIDALPARAVPVITGVEPEAGVPGTSVRITGQDLGDVIEVWFDLGLANFTVVSDALLVATVPLDATTGPVSVFDLFGATSSTLQHFRVSPRIIGFTPSSAPPGAEVVIDGFNFEGATAVQFNGTNASFRVTGPTQALAMVPVGATNGPISLTTPVGTARSRRNFIVTGLEPFIADFTPASGAPGDVVTIQGVNFTGATAVRFANTNAQQFAVTSPTQIRATVPASAATGPITVATALGTNLSTAPFIVTTAPIIEEFSPFGGPPGTRVIINGANFTGATAVRIAGRPAVSVSIAADSQLHATVPSGATNGPITITTPRGTGTSAEDFLATTGPIITEFSPAAGAPNSLVTVEGINFTTVTGARIGNVNAQIRVNAPTQISLTVPPNATNGPITLVSAAGTVTTPVMFLVRTGRPIMTGLDPDAGPNRSLVIIDGLDLTGATAVRFNGVPAEFSVVADTQINALVPAAATTGPVTVTNPRGTDTSPRPFFVAPRLTSFAPASGAAGTEVTVRGTNLADLIAVRVREVSATVQSASSNAVTLIVPAEATTGSINVITPAGIVATTNQFVVLPAITDFTPASGTAGTNVTIFGTGFGGVRTVRFGALEAAAFSVLSATQIVARVPARAATAPVEVVTDSGAAASARPFVVGVAADLALSQTASTNAAVQNQRLIYNVTVTNLGPSAAAAVTLVNTLPNGVSIESFQASQGTVNRRGSQVTAALGGLASGAVGNLTLTVLVTAADRLTNNASVTAQEPDPNSANNTSTLVIEVASNPAQLRIQELSATTLRLAWPASATGFVLQSRDALVPGSSWQDVSATPGLMGDQMTVTLPAPDRNRFYRLVRPL